jgi:hypothetical protein
VNQQVEQAVRELEAAYPGSRVTVLEDGQGGAHVFVEEVDFGPSFSPQRSWMGGHVTALYPQADIYPVFIGREIARTDGRAFTTPVTASKYQGRDAWQVSRANRQIHAGPQTVVMKFAKIRHFLETLS